MYPVLEKDFLSKTVLACVSLLFNFYYIRDQSNQNPEDYIDD